MARPSCLRLLAHLMRAAAARTFCTAGSSRPIRMAMIAMTTNSSMSVNADRLREWLRFMKPPSERGKKDDRAAPAVGCRDKRSLVQFDVQLVVPGRNLQGDDLRLAPDGGRVVQNDGD